jgi:two-component system, response regulator RegA
LLVDDDPRQLRAMARTSSRRHRVLTATTPEIARAVARTSKPDLIAIDLQLGDAPSGIDLVAMIREEQSAVPIVVVSAYLSPVVTEAAMRVGANRVLEKPTSIPAMIASLEAEDPRRVRIRDRPSLAQTIYAYIARIFADTGGNVSEAARILGIDRNTVKRHLRQPAPRAPWHGSRNARTRGTR